MAAEMQNLRPQIVFMAEETKQANLDPNERSAASTKERELLGDDGETPEGNLFESTEEQRKFKIFIDQFFKGLDGHQELKAKGTFASTEAKNDLILNVAQILHCVNTEDLDVDQNVLSNLPENS